MNYLYLFIRFRAKSRFVFFPPKFIEKFMLSSLIKWESIVDWERYMMRKPRLRFQTEFRYVQTVPDGKCQCPDPPRRKVPMFRLSCVQKCLSPDFRAFKNAYVQTIVRSKMPIFRLSCVQKCLCPDYRAFKNAYLQTFVRSKMPMSRLSCVQKCLSPDFRAFKNAYVQTIVRSKMPISRLSCVQKCLCPDYRAFKNAYVQIIVRSKMPMSRLSCVHFFQTV